MAYVIEFRKNGLHGERLIDYFLLLVFGECYTQFFISEILLYMLYILNIIFALFNHTIYMKKEEEEEFFAVYLLPTHITFQDFTIGY